MAAKRIKKPKKPTYHLKKLNLFDAIELFKKKYRSFILTKTGHTYKFETKSANYFFYEELSSVKSFIAFNKIEKDATPKLSELNPVKFKSINYYYFSENITIKECDCVDITSAYPSALFNAELITEETFRFLMKLKKPDRLKAIGMTATNKAIYTVLGNRLIHVETKKKETEKIFTNVCKLISDIMTELVNEYGELIYFFWVDGIFCHNSITDKIKNKIESIAYACKVEQVRNIRKSKKSNLLFYEKAGKDGIFKPKILPIPVKKTIHDDRIIDLFINKSEKIPIIAY